VKNKGQNMKFTESHEWISLQDNIATVGVTDFAQNELGEIVYVELPKVGMQVEAGEEVCVLESTKAAADVYSPVSGEIIEVNHSLDQETEKINESSENEGWLFKIKLTNPLEYKGLLTLEEYQNLLD
jgi:glycine cleavage system H protein